MGTVRRPPRGVPKEQFAQRDYYDVWLPNLAPSEELETQALAAHDDKARAVVRRLYRAVMMQPDASHLLDLLAARAHQTAFSVGCFFDIEARCHRSLLRELLQERGAEVA